MACLGCAGRRAAIRLAAANVMKGKSVRPQVRAIASSVASDVRRLGGKVKPIKFR